MTAVRFTAVVALLALVAVFAFGQAETGSIAGTVTDPSGAVVPGATVTVRNLATGATRNTTTNQSGAYTEAQLAPGNYEVAVSSANFAPYKQNVNVAVGSRNEVSPQMQVAAGSTTVEVVAGGGGTQVETQNSDISTVVGAQQINSLPTLTRNPYDFVGLAGNVAEDPGNGFAPRGANGLNINGQRTASTDIMLDGAENVDLFYAGVGQQVPLDSVQEFRVTTSSFGAEYGRASGGVVNLATKSGSNAFHGSLYEYNRVSALASNTYDNNANGTPKAPFTRNQFGYSLGGPIFKNKLFFFSNTEWTRVRSSANQLAYVLDPAFISQTAANTQDFFNAYGQIKAGVLPRGVLTANDLINQGIAGGTGGPFESLAPGTPVLDLVQYVVPTDVGAGAPENAWNSILRVDYNLSDKTQVYGRYAVLHNNFFPGFVSSNAYAGYDTGEFDLNQNALLSVTHIFSPSVVSTTKFSFNRLNDLQAQSSRGSVPNMFFTTGGQLTINSQTTMLPGYLPTSTANSIPFGGPQNVGQISQGFSVGHGAHQFRFGGQYIYTQDNRVFGAYQEGQDFLAKNSGAIAFDNLMTGQLYRFSAAIDPQGKFPCFRDPATNAPIQTPSCTLQGPLGAPNFSRSNRYNDGSVYFEDQWKTSSRLTLNLGLRWEYYGVQHDKHPANDANFVLGAGNNILTQVANGFVANGNNLPDGRLWNPNYHNFAPRLGFAYDLTGDGKTSLRGGYGLAYERNFGNVTFNVIQNPPNYAVINITEGQDVPAGSLLLNTANLGAFAQPISKAFPSPTLRAVDRNIKSAYSHMWNLSIEREVAPNTVAALEYSGSRGLHGYSISNFNDTGLGPIIGVGCSPGQNQATCDNTIARPNLQYNSINYRTNGSDSYHHALNARLQANNLRNTGLTMTANYTYSHTIDNLSATFGGSDELNGNTLGFLYPFTPALDRSDADYDIRHRFSVSAVWAIPFARNTHGIAKQILDGWEISPILSARTGYPLTVYDCTDANFNCPRYIPSWPVSKTGSSTTSSGSQGPNVFTYLTLPPAVAYLGPGSAGFSETPTCDANGVCSFPSNMTGRNFFRQPGFYDTTLAVYKTFKVTERFGVQLRAEAYNALNHSNYYVQTGALNNVSGFGADAVATTLNPATAPRVVNAGVTNGAIEWTDAAGAGVPYTLIGKKGNPNANLFGSLGERRNMQLAIRVTF